MLIIAQVLKQNFEKSPVLLIHKQQTSLGIKLPTIPPRLAGKIAKNRQLSEPIRLQDLEDSARSQAREKISSKRLI